MRNLYISLFAIAILTFASCVDQQRAATSSEKNTASEATSEVELTQQQLSTVGIKLGKVADKSLSAVIRTNGELMLNPQDKAEVTSLVGGVVRKVNVQEGQSVRAGQVVAYLANTEMTELQKNYLVAVREKSMAQLELQRQKLLATQGAGVEKTLQLAAATYATAQARQMGLYHQLVQIGISPSQVAKGKMTTQVAIRATISGMVSNINVSTGSYVDTSAPLMRIVNNDAVFARFNVFEKDVNQVAVGQNVELMFTNNAGLRVVGKVVRVNRSLNAQTKAVAVHVKIMGKPAQPLMEGMYVTGVIHTDQQKVKALPEEAIVSAEGKNYVFVLSGMQTKDSIVTYHFKRVEITTGVSELGFTQVNFLKPIAADATVVTSKAFYLASMSAEKGED